MLSSQKMVDYCIMSVFVIATPFRDGGLKIFRIFSCHWSSNSLLCCRCREKLNNCRLPSSVLAAAMPRKHLGPQLALGWVTTQGLTLIYTAVGLYNTHSLNGLFLVFVHMFLKFMKQYLSTFFNSGIENHICTQGPVKEGFKVAHLHSSSNSF